MKTLQMNRLAMKIKMSNSIVKKKLAFYFTTAVLLLIGTFIDAQPSGYWQQKVKYTMDIDVDAAANKFKGKQKLEYTNNSPDTLDPFFIITGFI